MKDALELAFNRAGGVKYLETVANDDPKTFCGLLSKLIPTNINVDVTTLNLGSAMLEASKRLDQYNATLAPANEPIVIDQQPDAQPTIDNVNDVNQPIDKE